MSHKIVERVQQYLARVQLAPDDERIDRDDGDDPSVTFGDLRALLALATRQVSDEQWQPIETAPKDGTHVLVTEFESIENYTFQYVAYWNEREGEWEVRWEDKPTPYFWTPLPKPPADLLERISGRVEAPPARD